MGNGSSDKLRVAVVGAGVSGLSSAFQILSSFKDEIKLTVLSKQRPEATTSYVAGGIWLPLGTFGPEAEHRLPQIREWLTETRKYFENLIGQSSVLRFGMQFFLADSGIFGSFNIYEISISILGLTVVILVIAKFFGFYCPGFF